jgi:hypothetical protein
MYIKLLGPVEQVRSKKPWSGRSKLAAVQPLWLNFRTLRVLSANSKKKSAHALEKTKKIRTFKVRPYNVIKCYVVWW